MAKNEVKEVKTGEVSEVVDGENNEEVTKEVVKNTEYYINLVLTKTATAQDKAELSRLLDEEANQEKENEISVKITAIKDFIVSQNMTVAEFVDAVKEPVQPILRWTDANGKVHEKATKNSQGKQQAWIAEFKKLKYEDALAFVVNDSADGKAWVKKLFGK